MARLFQAIEEYGYRENTLVIFTTDHGLDIPRGKGTLYDRGMETALLIQMPKSMPQQARVEHLIQNMDLVPTLLEAVGVPVPNDLAGKSFWPLLKGEPYEAHQHIVTEWNFGGPYEDYDPRRAVRSNDHLYIKNFGENPVYNLTRDEVPEDYDCFDAGKQPRLGPLWSDPSRRRPAEELYDVQADPWLTKNLAEESPEIVKSYATLLKEWMSAQHDDLLLKGEKPPAPVEPPGFGIPENT
jgi:arylsulfatase A-like enzyme